MSSLKFVRKDNSKDNESSSINRQRKAQQKQPKSILKQQPRYNNQNPAMKSNERQLTLMNLLITKLQNQNIELRKNNELLSNQLKERDNQLKQTADENNFLKDQLIIYKNKCQYLNLNNNQILSIKPTSLSLGNSHYPLNHHQNSNSNSKQTKNNTQFGFIKQCQQQIKRLRLLVNTLNQEKQRHQIFQSINQREQIKDRIIMKLEDQLITTKLLLQQQKQRSNAKNKTQASQLYSPLQQIHNSSNTNRGNSGSNGSKGSYSRSNNYDKPSYQRSLYQYD